MLRVGLGAENKFAGPGSVEGGRDGGGGGGEDEGVGVGRVGGGRTGRPTGPVVARAVAEARRVAVGSGPSISIHFTETMPGCCLPRRPLSIVSSCSPPRWRSMAARKRCLPAGTPTRAS